MGVFLRWGIFGILAVAALIYAFNALEHIADARRQKTLENTVNPASPAPAAAPAGEPAVAVAAPARPVQAADDVPERCRVEIEIAQRAAQSRSIGEPLDRLLRIQEIAWQEDAKRRERLTALATDWYNRASPIDAARLRADVLHDCLDVKP
ncbi:MAG TPA: hypothetical protein VMF52_17285 [Steroidobacteraceae bacterium]|nr:hypothetical protein [Steroidobacteraceae bacterium]